MLWLRSFVAVVRGSVVKLVSKFLTFGRRSALQDSEQSIALVGRVMTSCFFRFPF